jgi:lipoyl-dependent peroxiredoxin
MQYVAARDALAIPPEIWVEGTVGVGAIPQGFGIEVELRIALPGLAHREAEALVNKATLSVHTRNAPRGNIAVCLVLMSSYA